MAFQETDNGQNNTGNGKDKADAWGNIVILDKQGNQHSLTGVFAPITANKNQLHRSLVNAAKANGGEVVLENVKLTIKLAAVDDGTDIELF